LTGTPSGLRRGERKMTARLGLALYWAATGLSVAAILLGVYLFFSRDAGDPDNNDLGSYTPMTSVAAGISVYVLGRACRFVTQFFLSVTAPQTSRVDPALV
jgi:hypothetical protein